MTAVADEGELAATRDGIVDEPPNRCPSCGRFLRKHPDDPAAYVRHVAWDDYNGGWEWTC